MTQLAKLRTEMAAYLREGGLSVLEAFPATARREAEGAFVLLSLKELESEEGSFLSYLGERYCPETDEYEEVYGRGLRLCFGLDLYAPKALGAEGTQEIMEKTGELLAQRAPRGLSKLRFSWGDVAYDRSAGLFRCEGRLFAEGLLYLVQDESGRFLSFEVRGGITLG